jgi:hypothetical protein
MFNTANLDLGPGLLLWASEGAAEPADLTAGWPGGWTYLGWTREGHQWTVNRAVEPLVEPEQAYPTTFVMSEDAVHVKLLAAELTIANWQLAQPGITQTATAWGVIQTARAKTATQPTAIALGWQAMDMSRRVIWRAAVQTAGLDIERRRSPRYATLPFDLVCQRPANGSDPWVQYLSDAVVGEYASPQ